jgi:phosphate transport system protein
MTTRTQFLYGLAELQRSLSQLAEGVERAVHDAMWALAHNDLAAAGRIKDADNDIDERRVDIEERVLQLVALQQPTAGDLRFVLGAVRIADELERMGDYAEGIAELVLRSEGSPPLELPAELTELSDQVQTMLRASVAAFISRDADAATTLEQEDDRADDLQRVVQERMVEIIRSRPEVATRALYLLFVGHNLERIADRTVNIAERTAFIVTGAPIPHRRKTEV